MGFQPVLDFSGSPTLSAMIFDDAFFKGTTGPVGSGKSTANCGELMKIGLSQQAAEKDNIRYTRIGVIRNTSPELKATTIKTWEAIFDPEHTGPVVYSSPINHHIRVPARPGVPGLDMEVLFVPLDKPKDVRKLLSFEFTAAFVNEACEVPKAIIDALTGRVGRYPAGDRGAPTWAGILADTNPPDDPDNWWNATKTGTDNGTDDDPLRWRFWDQPPAVIECRPAAGSKFESVEPGFLGLTFERSSIIEAGGTWWALNPLAENLNNLRGTTMPGPDGRMTKGGDLYYAQLLKNKRKDWIQRFAQGKCVYVQDGKPVFPEFNPEFHVRTLEVLPDVPILAGVDIGGGTLQPAVVFGQRHPRGPLLLHREMPCFDLGIETFSTLFAQTVAMEFPGREVEVAWCDPASEKRDELYEVAIVQHLRSKNIKARPAPTNDPKVRREALAMPMCRVIDGKPGLMVDPRCKMLIQGLSGKWKFAKLNVSGTVERYADKPEKSKWSHVCEAAEYLALGAGEHAALTKGRGPHSGHTTAGGVILPNSAPPVARIDFDVFGGG